jgi:hypothetical protein
MSLAADVDLEEYVMAKDKYIKEVSLMALGERRTRVNKADFTTAWEKVRRSLTGASWRTVRAVPIHPTLRACSTGPSFAHLTDVPLRQSCREPSQILCALAVPPSMVLRRLWPF